MTDMFPRIIPGKVAVLALLPFAEPATGSFCNGPDSFIHELQTYATSTGSACAIVTEPHPVAQIRLISGLTFEQLSKVFKVSRRALHLWVSGQRMQPANEERAGRILECLLRIDRGAPDLTRAALLEHGARAMDLLAEGCFGEVLELLGAESPTESATRPSPAIRPEREPAAPADLVSATQAGPHPAIAGGKRIANFKVRRAKREK